LHFQSLAARWSLRIADEDQMTDIRLVSSIVVSALLSCGSPESPPAADTIPAAGS
jgi:hypothetical protein